MLNHSEVYLFSDQPTTCPKCGTRTEITLDLYETPEKTQHHKCLSPKCGFEFVVQVDVGKNNYWGHSSLISKWGMTPIIIIYKITKPLGITFNLKDFNISTYKKSETTKIPKISLRLKELEDAGFKVEFLKIQSNTLDLNLRLIDSQLPEIISFLVKYKYTFGKRKLKDLLEVIKDKNPLKFDISKGHPFYEYKIKNFLTENALGMTPETVWTGVYDATGEIIIVKEDGDVVCYNIYNKNEFQDYLINNTVLEQASTSEDKDNPGFALTSTKAKPYKFGWVYEENGELFIKLNLQIRFN